MTSAIPLLLTEPKPVLEISGSTSNTPDFWQKDMTPAKSGPGGLMTGDSEPRPSAK